MAGCAVYARIPYRPLPTLALSPSGTAPDSGRRVAAALHTLSDEQSAADIIPPTPEGTFRLWSSTEQLVLAMLAITVLLHGWLVAALHSQRQSAPSESLGLRQTPVSRSAAASSVMRSRCTQVHYTHPKLGPAEPAAGSGGRGVPAADINAEPPSAASSLDISLGTLATEARIPDLAAKHKAGPERSVGAASELIRSSAYRAANDSPWQRTAQGGRLSRQKSASLVH